MLHLLLSLSLSHTGHWKFNMAPHDKELSEDLKKMIFALHKDGVGQGFSKSAFKGPNFHQCQKSGPEQLVITKLVFNKHTVVYITCITNNHTKKIKFPLHSKYINNKSKMAKQLI